ncbi:hypothetical protein CHLRE_03g167050v5 [Chlamydomonas reinhardtii]|uniref:Ketopantoate reductase C-terminal domain-containing protein n=1 Tax=Chlamydomonas reinhardtii TaxID=3055 RepID=A0A2K3DWU1_CHLRE|nr:uncharacterized protein CHLRE_03g167050v5 [Chlamydomonas reinhardtii]PNW84988.1 hypothetical protein CHLRE_03g167050v5 [Chlamydomonas reinhardtii]
MATLIGPGRVGKAIAGMLGAELGAVVTRQSGAVDPHGQGPIYVCTTNDALDWVLEQTPRNRRCDLVFFQNGWLAPWLAHNSLRLGPGSAAGAAAEGGAAAAAGREAEAARGDGGGAGGAEASGPGSAVEVTLVALYMAAGPDGTAKDGLRTVASGRWAQHVSRTLSRGAVRCRAVGGADMYGAVVEKLLWACVFWMMSAALGGMNVGDIVARHRGDVAALTAELLPPLCRQLRGIAAAGAGPEAAEAAAALEAPAGAERVVAALVEYSVSISSAVPSRDMALAEFRWRNGALLDMGPTPLHVSWLRRAGVPAELLEGHGVAARAEPEVAG